MDIYSLPTPALLLDVDIMEKNLQRMQQRANRLGVSLRPHIKTHKCIEIGNRQKALGAKGITVSTFYEAEQFADEGFDDITWAFPIPPVFIPHLFKFSKGTTLRVLVDSIEAIDALKMESSRREAAVHVWLKIDSGHQRVGVSPESRYAEECVATLQSSRYIVFDGILTHAGQSYQCASKEEIIAVAEHERSVMVNFAERMRKKGYAVPAISVGSTPTMRHAQSLEGVDEMRPGNYVFYDYYQTAIGNCDVKDCAVTVLASVVSHQPGASHFVIDAGALALSKDPGPTHRNNYHDLGVVFDSYELKGVNDALHLRSMSQEHGKVLGDNNADIDGKFKVGEKVRILMNHSCLTVANFDRYHVVRGKNVIDQWKILRGRM
jgi:D-serine deaminase-like pyridoxal phosphate-dependent protein